jgi:HlyD family secretion protein
MYYLIPAILLAGATAAYTTRGSSSSNKPAVARAVGRDPRLIAAPGRVEPVSEEIKIASEIAGRLRSVPVEEGDRVRRGQMVAELSNDDYRARRDSAQAELAMKEAELRRVVNGSRDQERREALAAVTEADAVLANAQAEMQRRDALYRTGDVARSEAERTEREYYVAKARYQAAKQHYSFVDADAREEDRSRAEADVALARARLAEAEATLEKTIIRSPIDGVVLRRYLKTGESVSDKPDTPIVSVGDPSVWRIRVDVDETDVARIHLGQRAYATADAYGDRKFWGRVVRVGEILGRKNVRTDEPTERVDTKILETLVELDKGAALPAGLRVDAFLVPEAK